MTFVAAQRGWDGVSLLGLLVVHWAVRWAFCGRDRMVDEWMRSEGVAAHVTSVEFQGRFAMLGAVQLYGGSAITSWMDDILVPHPRREAWLRCLDGQEPDPRLPENDRRLVASLAEASFAAADVLKTALAHDCQDLPIVV
jgi:hypothetical protein